MEKSLSIFEYLTVVPEIKIIYSPNGLKSYKGKSTKLNSITFSFNLVNSWNTMTLFLIICFLKNLMLI